MLGWPGTVVPRAQAGTIFPIGLLASLVNRPVDARTVLGSPYPARLPPERCDNLEPPGRIRRLSPVNSTVLLQLPLCLQAIGTSVNSADRGIDYPRLLTMFSSGGGGGGDYPCLLIIFSSEG